jgi:hypothetical protein
MGMKISDALINNVLTNRVKGGLAAVVNYGTPYGER